MKDNNIYKKMINYMYQSITKTMTQLPFSGQHWLEQFVLEVARYLLEEYGENLQITSKKPIDVCQAFLNLMAREDFLDAGDYRLEESGVDILVYVNTENCVYRQYCSHSKMEGFPITCIRLAAFQAVLSQIINKSYSALVEVDWESGICQGKLTLSSQPQEEIVTREGHILKLAGRRAVLFPQEIYASLLISIREHAPHALKHVIYDAGYQSGFYLAHKVRSLYPRIEECVQLLLREMKNGGLGKFELVSLDISRIRARIISYDSFQVDMIKDYGSLYRTPQVTCDLIRGILAAYFSVLFEKEIICEEMTCQSMGGNYCEFFILSLPREFGKREGVL
jgi:predicted hydrocarbon binding protein